MLARKTHLGDHFGEEDKLADNTKMEFGEVHCQDANSSTILVFTKVLSSSAFL